MATLAYALKFDGSQNYLDLGTMGSFGSNLGSGIYIKFQIKTTVTSIVAFGNSFSGQQLQVTLNQSSDFGYSNISGAICIEYQDNASNYSLCGFQSPTINFNDGNIHIVEISINVSAKTLVIKIDGVSQSVNNNLSTMTSFINFVGNFRIGCVNNFGTNQKFISATFYNLQIGTSAGTLYGNYQMNEGTGTTTADSSGNGNTGTLSGSPLPLWVTGNLVQSSGTAALGLGSTSAVWASNTTTGNLIAVGVTLTNTTTLGTVTSVTDSQSNTYLKAISGTKSSSLVSVIDEEIWYAKNITGGAGSVTVNHTIDNAAIYVREYSYYNSLNVTNSAIGSSLTPNTGTVNTTIGTQLLVISTGDDKGTTQTYAAAGSFADMLGTTTTLTGVSMEDGITMGTAAQTGTLTLGSSANWVSLMASFYNTVISKNNTYKSLLGVGI